ncbi:MAG TPA: benzoate-CoA ligase family protein [Acidimicrobiia bacterium]|nr:benzoate-CoA ligase family protein [Acidimicrobiia bacterium]
MIRWPERLNVDRFLLRGRLDEGLGDATALLLDDRAVSYAEVDEAASALGVILGDLGVGPQDRVLIVLPDALPYVAALFGIFRLGAVAIMLNPGLTVEAMAAIIRTSRATAAVVHADHLALYREAVAAGEWEPGELIVDDTLPLSGYDLATYDTAAGDPALWLFSGGTTGSPKAVPQSHRSLANTTQLYGQGSLGLTGDDVTIAVPKLYFGYATGSNLFFPLSVGASTVLFPGPPFPEAIIERVERHRATVLVTVPSAVNQLLSHSGVAKADLSSLRFATTAGEALPETLYHRWKDRFGVELLDGLGTAEMWHIFITNTIGDVRPGTLGRVVPGFEIKACDEDGVEVAPGKVGRLWVRGQSLGPGYWQDPEKTIEAFRGEWFVGGDLVSIDEEGYVTHRGRADDAIKVKGKWFRPQEVESTLLDHEAVRECAVVAVNDSDGLAKPVAFVVADGVDEQELIDWVLSHLEPYKHPRRVFFVDRLPQTHLGKVDRSALKRMVV